MQALTTVSKQKAKRSHSEIRSNNKRPRPATNTPKHVFNTIMGTSAGCNLCADLDGDFGGTRPPIPTILRPHPHAFTKCDDASGQISSANDPPIISDLDGRTHTTSEGLFSPRGDTTSPEEARNRAGVAGQSLPPGVKNPPNIINQNMSRLSQSRMEAYEVDIDNETAYERSTLSMTDSRCISNINSTMQSVQSPIDCLTAANENSVDLLGNNPTTYGCSIAPSTVLQSNGTLYTSLGMSESFPTVLGRRDQQTTNLDVAPDISDLSSMDAEGLIYEQVSAQTAPLWNNAERIAVDPRFLLSMNVGGITCAATSAQTPLSWINAEDIPIDPGFQFPFMDVEGMTYLKASAQTPLTWTNAEVIQQGHTTKPQRWS